MAVDVSKGSARVKSRWRDSSPVSLQNRDYRERSTSEERV